MLLYVLFYKKIIALKRIRKLLFERKVNNVLKTDCLVQLK